MSDSGRDTTGERTNATTDNEPSTSPKGVAQLIAHVSSHKVDVALWVTRIVTMSFTLLYILPLMGVNSYVCYQRALMSNAATSALRLHQRLPRVQLTREFLAQLLLEDSCHYLFYSLIFLFTHPITMALMPVFLFAVLHSASYSLTLLDQLGQSSWWGARMLISMVEFQQRNILRLVAFTEIFLMPLAIAMIFMGRISLLAPFMYYRFLTLRYASRRNPFTRQVFHELKMVVECQVNRAGCPPLIRNASQRIISFVSHLAPPSPA